MQSIIYTNSSLFMYTVQHYINLQDNAQTSNKLLVLLCETVLIPRNLHMTAPEGMIP